jgi:hypothetical protein
MSIVLTFSCVVVVQFDFEVRSDTARGRLLVSKIFKIRLVHFLHNSTRLYDRANGSAHPSRPPLVRSVRHVVLPIPMIESSMTLV